MSVDIVGVKVNNISKTQALKAIEDFVAAQKPHYIVTPYSEMIVFAQKDARYQEALNNADLSLPDGIGIVWAAKVLGNKISERITGRKFVFDLMELAAKNNYSVSLVGGEGNIAAQAAYELKKLYPSLNIKLALSGRPFDGAIVREIAESNSDILLIAYSPPKQELWLHDNKDRLNARVAIGLGGTFDYLAGKRPVPPEVMHKLGLEWFWRLITQPWRIKRIWNAVPVFIWTVYKCKLYGKHQS